MPIEFVLTGTAVCDRCDEHYGFRFCSDGPKGFKKELTCGGWLVARGLVLCPGCATRNIRLSQQSKPPTTDSVTPKLRFEILKRDGFRCQYCGKASPDVKLEVDHINPVARGGKSSPDNLVTACFECNRGKRDEDLA